MRPDNRAITLIELIISVILLSLVSMGFYGIEMFSKQQFLSADRRAKVQNEAMYILSHIVKHSLMAIGDADHFPVSITNAGVMTSSLTIETDFPPDGMRDPATDSFNTYCYNNNGCNAPSTGPYTLSFNFNTTGSPPPAGEVLGTHVKSFQASVNENYVNLAIETCWDPAESSKPCGSMDNPAFFTNSSAIMPSVSSR